MQIKVEFQAFEFPLRVVKTHIREGINRAPLIDLELASSVSLKTDCRFYCDQNRILMTVEPMTQFPSISGYQTTGEVASSNDPAQKFTIKQLG